MDSKTSLLPVDEVEPNTSEGIDPQFACMEATLLDHWEQNKVPLIFEHNPKEFISEIVQRWWEMLVEAACIRNDINRTNWHRTRPEGEVESSGRLYERLETARRFISVDEIRAVRNLSLDEKMAIAILYNAIGYYQPFS